MARHFDEGMAWGSHSRPRSRPPAPRRPRPAPRPGRPGWRRFPTVPGRRAAMSGATAPA